MKVILALDLIKMCPFNKMCPVLLFSSVDWMQQLQMKARVTVNLESAKNPVQKWKESAENPVLTF